MTHPLRSRHRGFTLIEVMVTVAIIGILASIALPSYQNYLRRGHRADAKAALLENAQFMERYFTERNSYMNGNALPALPVTQSPREAGSTQLYAVTLSQANTTATTYQLLASPVAGRMMANDACGTLSIDNRGVKAASGTGMSAADCWAK
jgi:type IV pilus assembly protein PilE